MNHKVEVGDIWQSTGLVKVAYLILEIDGKKIHVLNLNKNEVTFVYEGFFQDDRLSSWTKV